MGDGEMAEGKVWEAAAFAGHYAHRQSGRARRRQRPGTKRAHHVSPRYRRLPPQIRVRGLGHGESWTATTWPPSSPRSIRRARRSGKPFAIIARTEKGHGISFLADKDGWHGKALSPEQLEKALAELGTDAADCQGRRALLRAQVASGAAGFPRAPAARITSWANWRLRARPTARA